MTFITKHLTRPYAHKSKGCFYRKVVSLSLTRACATAGEREKGAGAWSWFRLVRCSSQFSQFRATNDVYFVTLSGPGPIPKPSTTSCKGGRILGHRHNHAPFKDKKSTACHWYCTTARIQDTESAHRQIITVDHPIIFTGERPFL